MLAENGGKTSHREFQFMTALRALAILSVFILTAATARAAEDGLERFLGAWTGAGVSEKFMEEGYFTYSTRDLNITFTRSDKGFDTIWTTGFRTEGDKGPVVLRKTTTLHFKEVAPGYFETEESPPWRRAQRWARLTKDGALIVYIFEVDDHGVYEISRYVRRITEDGMMELGFSRDLDGRPVRQVTGTLTREGG